MAELIFIATTVFVAYVVFTVIGEDKKQPDQSPSVTTDHPQPVTETITPTPPAPTTTATASKRTASKSKATTSTQPAAASTTPNSDSLKNPKTGEIAKLPNNYAFAKRWIKEALVEEGLLDKIYKNNELNSDINLKIQAALQQLQSLEKYR